MKTEIKREIIASLEHFMKLHGLSANKVSNETGISSSYISIMRSGAETIKVGDSEVEIADRYYEQIAMLTGYALQKSYWEPRNTAQAARIISTLEDAKRFGDTNLVIGETGCGKTYVARVFARKHPVDFFIITVGSEDFINDIIEKIAIATKLRLTAKSKSRRISEIIKHLKAMRVKGYKPLLYFDESEYMKQSMLMSMKELYDNLQGVCGIVLGGTDQLLTNIEKLRKKNKPGIPQFYRRIKFGIRLLPAIDKSYSEFIGEYDKPLQRFLKENCDNYGELHDVLVPALREADRTGEPLSEEFVKMVLAIRH